MKRKNFFIVKEIKGSFATVSPFSSEILNEKSKTDAEPKKRPLIQVIVLKNQKLREGSIVRVAFARKAELFTGFFILLFPVFMSFAGYFASFLFSYLFGFFLSETIKFLFVLIFFLLTSLAEFLLTRKTKKVFKPIIVKVLKY